MLNALVIFSHRQLCPYVSLLQGQNSPSRYSFTLFVQGSFLCPDQVYARNISSQRWLCPRGSGCSISQRLLCPYRPNVNKFHVQYNCSRRYLCPALVFPKERGTKKKKGRIETKYQLTVNGDASPMSDTFYITNHISTPEYQLYLHILFLFSICSYTVNVIITAFMLTCG